MTQDISYLNKALDLAAMGLFRTAPNPRVGCVLVKDGQVVGVGWHQYVGGPHAEIRALAEAGDRASGATAYVSLEPCCHYGRTGPCVDALIKAGIVAVRTAMLDPDPRVSGRGLARLRAAGVDAKVVAGLREQAQELNRGYLHRLATGLPWVRIKLAASLDGRTASATGESKWITSSYARADVQHWRAQSSAIVTGSGTVLADDPHLGLRSTPLAPNPDCPEDLRQPLRVVLDRRARVSGAAKIFSSAGRSFWLTEANVSAPTNATITKPPPGKGWTPAEVIMWLSKQGCSEVLVEAGATLTGAFLAAHVVDEVLLYLAPTLLGSKGRPLAWLDGLEQLRDRIGFQYVETTRIGPDLRIIARPSNPTKG